MPIIVPLWFYEFGSVMYFVAAIIGALLTYFSLKLYNITRKRPHLFLTLSFLFITIGFVILTGSNTYSHLRFEGCKPNCFISQQQIFTRIVVANDIYYLFSIVGYSLFLLSYPIFSQKGSKNLLMQVAPPLGASALLQGPPLYVLYPFESMFFQPFHIISAILLALIVMKTYSNYRKSKSDIAFLIPAGFSMILLYHILMFSVPFFPLFFAFAHLSLLAGFSLLLWMLVRVTKR